MKGGGTFPSLFRVKDTSWISPLFLLRKAVKGTIENRLKTSWIPTIDFTFGGMKAQFPFKQTPQFKNIDFNKNKDISLEFTGVQSLYVYLVWS